MCKSFPCRKQSQLHHHPPRRPPSCMVRHTSDAHEPASRSPRRPTRIQRRQEHNSVSRKVSRREGGERQSEEEGCRASRSPVHVHAGSCVSHKPVVRALPRTCSVTGNTSGSINMMQENTVQKNAMAATGLLARPKWKGPLGKSFSLTSSSSPIGIYK